MSNRSRFSHTLFFVSPSYIISVDISFLALKMLWGGYFAQLTVEDNLYICVSIIRPALFMTPFAIIFRKYYVTASLSSSLLSSIWFKPLST